MPAPGPRRHHLALAVVGLALAAAVGDLLRLPFPYVPPSARLLPAIAAGALLGPAWGTLSQGLFAAAALAAALLGAAGAPGAGETVSAFRLALPADLGYRLALPLCAAVVGRLAGPERKATRWRVLAAACLGLAAVDAAGLAALAWLLPPRLPQPLARGGLLRVGFLFTLPWDLAQVLVAAWVVPIVRRRGQWLAFPVKSR